MDVSPGMHHGFRGVSYMVGHVPGRHGNIGTDVATTYFARRRTFPYGHGSHSGRDSLESHARENSACGWRGRLTSRRDRVKILR